MYPDIGLELEIRILCEDVETEDSLSDIIYRRLRNRHCVVSVESSSEIYRLEISLPAPTKNIKKIVKYLRRVLSLIYRTLRQVKQENEEYRSCRLILEKFRRYSGSTHVTLDLKEEITEDFITNLNYLVTYLSVLYDNTYRDTMCSRILRQSTTKACIAVPSYADNILIPSSVIIDLNPTEIDELVKALRNNDLEIKLEEDISK